MSGDTAISIKKYKKDRIHQQRIWCIVCLLALLVAGAVFWYLRLIGITMSDEACCGKIAHTHTEECIPERVLICGMEETTSTDEMLVDKSCQIAEHTHSSGCYSEDGCTLLCELSEIEYGHIHGDSCYSLECRLVCELPEHAHTEACMRQAEEPAAPEHIHTDECYRTVYRCGFNEEHIHDLMCYSDPGADVETSSDWEATLPDSLSGNWPEDLIAVAKSQLGYTESERNFVLGEDGETRLGYTRYGAWADNPHGNWNGLFAAFCVRYAGVPEGNFPTASGGYAWRVRLNDAGLYKAADSYTPQEGDLIFFNDDSMGIVIAVRDNTIYVIAGERNNAVAQERYKITDSRIKGYGSLTAAYANTLPVPEDELAEGNISAVVSEPTQEAGGTDSTICTVEGDRDNAVVQTSRALYDRDIEGYGNLSRAYEEAVLMSPLAAPPSGGTYNPTVVPAPDYIGAINTANAWQIVSQRYSGREQSNKIAVDSDNDGKTDVYLQKNVVPTATENEFLVYLSMDTKMTWENLFDESAPGLTSSNGLVPGAFVSKIQGNVTEIGPKGATGEHAYSVIFHMYENAGSTTPLYTYSGLRYGSTPNCSNGSLWLKLPGLDQYLVLQNQVTLKTDGNGQGSQIEANLYLNDFPFDFAFYNTVFDSVSDIMGENVIYEGLVNCDGSASFDKSTNTLTWNPIENPNVVSPIIQNGSALSGWMNNIAQLVYRVRLDVEADDFDSCADNMNSGSSDLDTYNVNRSAQLTFHKEALEGATGISTAPQYASYPVPEVRGLLYDITFIKKSDDGKDLSGAVFGLFEADGTTAVERNGQHYTVTSVAGEVSKFLDLPFGTYVVKEMQPPPYYSAPANASWTVTTCYTTNPGQLTRDSVPDDDNMRWSGNDANGEWVIFNTKGPFHYQIMILKTDKGGNTYLPDAVFELLNEEESTDENGELLFEDPFSPNIEYTITELEAPDGYYRLTEPIRFRVEGNEETGEYTVNFINQSSLDQYVSMVLDESGEITTLRITVKNETGYALPEAGSSGTMIYTFGGVLLMALPLMYSCKQRHNHKKRRLRS